MDSHRYRETIMRSLVAVFTLPVLLAGAVAVGAEPQTRPADKRESNRPPNVVLFLIDDLGWKDLGCQGSTYYRTPNIDRLARDGARFTDVWVSADGNHAWVVREDAAEILHWNSSMGWERLFGPHERHALYGIVGDDATGDLWAVGSEVLHWDG